jgi:hypothetical protein
LYQAAAAAHGRELQLGEDTAIGYRFFIASSKYSLACSIAFYWVSAMKNR